MPPLRSLHVLGGANLGPLGVLSQSLVIDLLVSEAAESGLDSVSLTHVEVLSEHLVSAPPVGVNHADSLVAENLMRVRVSHVVLVTINGEASVRVRRVVVTVVLADVPLPLGNHVLLLLLGEQVQHKGLIQVENEEGIGDADAVLRRQHGDSPVGVAEGVLKEASDVLEGTPFLGLITGLVRLLNKLGEVTIGVLGKSSVN